MCGISGWYGPRDASLLRRMASLLDHRGPDGEGFFSDKNASLGHKRLSIIDLKTGQQPMYNDDKSVVLVFNGEIYNYRELRKDLEGKYQFKTKSDSEVILRSYEEHGPECVQKFNGMFAFAIWDAKKEILFLARDRVGIKPLYYHQSQGKAGRFMFSSEIKAFLADEHFPRRMNIQAVAEYLTFQNIMDDKTFFEGVKMLLPGHYILVQDGVVSIKQYWDASYTKTKKKEVAEYYDGFRKIFSESVQRHMVSDVPLGSYLSGGFDSGSVAMMAAKLAAKNGKKKIKTFTGRFAEGGIYDEGPCARAVAVKANAVMHEVTIAPHDFLSNIERIIYHLDEPKVGIPAISQYMVSKLVSEQVKVVLTGHAGDELFAGYPVYKAAYFKDLLKQNPLYFWRFFTLFRWSEMPRAAYFLLFPFFEKEVKHGLFIMFNQRQRRKLLTREFYQNLSQKNTVSVLRKYDRKDIASFADKAQYLYLKTYLPSLLVVEDKMGMAHSIEARTPFCDNELIEFANSVPMAVKLHRQELKHLVKQSMKNDLPEILYHQPKKGFPTPFSLWLRKDRNLKEYVYSVLLSERTKKRGIFHQSYVKKLLDEHCCRSADGLLDLVNAARIWSLLNVELWCRLFIDGEYTKFATDKLKKPGRKVKT